MSESRASATEIRPSGFFALRTPLLPFDELLAWSDGLEAASAGDDPARLEAALRGRSRLPPPPPPRGLPRPEVREALFVASPGLEERFDRWLREPEDPDDRKIERALVRYFARMAGRATPFGLFAGCSVGTVGDETGWSSADRACYRRHTRLDMDYLVALTDALAREPDVPSAPGVRRQLQPLPRPGTTPLSRGPPQRQGLDAPSGRPRSDRLPRSHPGAGPGGRLGGSAGGGACSKTIRTPRRRRPRSTSAS